MSTTGTSHGRIGAPRKSARAERRGFALLITITLLAFLVLLLVSLASLTRVETQVAANSRQMAGARQNALMALNVAMGQLQRYAGPDTRITARAELRPATAAAVKQPHLTGVWDTLAGSLDYATPATWLISGNEGADPRAVNPDTLDPETDATADEVFLVDLNSVANNSERIKAQKQTITSLSVPGSEGDPVEVGSYAFWVGDEGVKANVTLIDPWPAGSSTATAEQLRYSFINAQRFGIEQVLGDTTVLGSDYPANTPAVRGMMSLDQLPFLGGDVDVLRQTRANRFHDLTAHSTSVLADVANGGLKKDLSNWLLAGSAPAGAIEQDAAPIISTSEGTGPGMPKWALLRSYAALTDNGGAIPVRAQTDSQQGVYPIITYFRMGVAVSCEGPGEPLKVHFFPTLVLWNPYSVPLAGSYELGFLMRGGISSTKLSFRVGPAEKDYLVWNRASLGGAGSSNQWFRFQVTPSAPIPAGQSLVFTLAATGPYVPAGNVLVDAADSGESAYLLGATLSAADIAAGIDWNRSEWTGNNMVAMIRPAGGTPPSGVGLTPGAFQTVQTVGYGNPPAVSASRPVPVDVLEPKIHVRLNANMSTSSGVHSFRWIAQQNYRAMVHPRPDFDGGAFHSVYAGAATANPPAPNFAEGGTRASAGVGVSGSTATDVVLSEILPQGAPLFSLAQLQHVNFSQLSYYPTYIVGNSLADPHVGLGQLQVPVAGGTDGYDTVYDLSYLLNRQLWDRYFFSTVDASFDAAALADTSRHLPNARHVIRRENAGLALSGLKSAGAFDTAAANLWLKGGFNVNSTSEQAWRALLASHFEQAVDPANNNNRHPLSRFAKPPAGNPNQAWAGYRILSDAQIERLAAHVVTEVKNRGPFLSLADFVNRRRVDANDAHRIKGALQSAIDRSDTEAVAPINTDAVFATNLVGTSGPSGSSYEQAAFQGGTTRQAPYSSRSAFAPGYLTQADVLTAIGPALTARSDTFRIRAYGEVLNPATGAIDGRAWCEAVVQRMPEYVEAATPAWQSPLAGSDNEKFGRRFKITTFRWLTPNDI